jgi:hypothetical protein
MMWFANVNSLNEDIMTCVSWNPLFIYYVALMILEERPARCCGIAGEIILLIFNIIHVSG